MDVKRGDPIVHNKLYNVNETAAVLDVNPRYVLAHSEEMGGKKVGRRLQFLGENLLSYLGSASYQPQPQQEQRSEAGVPSQN